MGFCFIPQRVLMKKRDLELKVNRDPLPKRKALTEKKRIHLI
jgi:hypothetical protein